MKFVELPTTDRSGRTLRVENGKVASVSISIEDHGCLTAWLFIDFNGGGCGFGGYMLGKADGGNIPGKGYAAEYIVRCLKTVGVGKWEDMAGEPIRCLNEGIGGGIVAIGNYLKDEWFCPRKEFENAE